MTSRYIGARVKSLGFLVFRVSAFVTSGMLGRRFAEEARAVRDACSLLDPRHFRVCVHVCVCVMALYLMDTVNMFRSYC